MNDTLKNIFQTLSESAEENFVKHKNANDYLAAFVNKKLSHLANKKVSQL